MVDGVNATPALWYVHADHLNRPIKMTDGAKTAVWTAVWAPWGSPHSITGTATLDARFPGQWYQLEAGLHYNWHRSYDPNLGRYTQPDPLGFVDGPSVFGYAGGSPHIVIDLDGQCPWCIPVILGAATGVALEYFLNPDAQPSDLIIAGGAGAAAGGLARCIPLINANRYLRIGPGRKGGSLVFRAAGSMVEKVTGKKKIDFFTIRKKL